VIRRSASLARAFVNLNRSAKKQYPGSGLQAACVMFSQNNSAHVKKFYFQNYREALEAEQELHNGHTTSPLFAHPAPNYG